MSTIYARSRERSDKGPPPMLAHFVLACCGLAATPARPAYWVYLTDKGLSPVQESAAIDAMESTADPLQVARRRLRRTDPGLFDARDLPVSPAALEGVLATGATLRQTSRWLNAVSVEASADQIDAIANLPGVASIRPVATGHRLTPIAPDDALASGPGLSRDFYGYSSAQLNQMNLPALHSQGFRGQGVVIAVLDTGLVRTHAAFNNPANPLNLIASYDFVKHDDNVGIQAGDDPDQHRHGTWITGCIGSYWPDTLVGGAYQASFIMCKTEDLPTETPIEEDNYVAGVEFAEAHGADVCTSSLGYIDWYTQAQLNGTTAVTTQIVNIASANGVHFCTAMGNSGHDANPALSHFIAPADAFHVISCGALDEAGNIAGFSSDGPTADGRVKPEILARGVNTLTVSSSNDSNLAQVSGTSLSTPLIAAAVACITSAHPNWTVAQMRRAILSTARDQVANGTFDPTFVRGYGLIDAAAAAAFPICSADFDADGTVDFFDYDAFVNCFEGTACPPGATADFDGDDTVDFFDYDAFVVAFEAGC
ncbi:MAG: S8 family serine peptidase [Planctomycetota bacterium]